MSGRASALWFGVRASDFTVCDNYPEGHGFLGLGWLMADKILTSQTAGDALLPRRFDLVPNLNIDVDGPSRTVLVLDLVVVHLPKHSCSTIQTTLLVKQA